MNGDQTSFICTMMFCDDGRSAVEGELTRILGYNGLQFAMSKMAAGIPFKVEDEKGNWVELEEDQIMTIDPVPEEPEEPIEEVTFFYQLVLVSNIKLTKFLVKSKPEMKIYLKDEKTLRIELCNSCDINLKNGKQECTMYRCLPDYQKLLDFVLGIAKEKKYRDAFSKGFGKKQKTILFGKGKTLAVITAKDINKKDIQHLG